MRQCNKNRAIVGLATVLASMAIGTSSEAADRKRITGSHVDVMVMSRTASAVGDRPAHEVALTTTKYAVKSADADWNDIEAITFGFSDTVAGSGPIQSYMTEIHRNGDRSYYRVEGSQKFVPKEGGAFEVQLEGTWQALGGTGKFKSLTGKGTFTGKATPKGTTIDWQGDVEY